jgi:hypothetical protein
MSKNIIFVLMYHRHTLLDLIIPNNSHIYGMRVFENRVVNRAFGAKRGSDWRWKKTA